MISGLKFNVIQKIPLLYSEVSFMKKHITQPCQKLSIRAITTKVLTHTDEKGKVNMVDVSDKEITNRTAVAEASIHVGPVIAKLVKENTLKKGDVISLSKVAGIMAAKKTSELIPLCHNIALNDIHVEAELQGKKC